MVCTSRRKRWKGYKGKIMKEYKKDAVNSDHVFIDILARIEELSEYRNVQAKRQKRQYWLILILLGSSVVFTCTAALLSIL